MSNSQKKIPINITFLEPYRLIEWADRNARMTQRRWLRGQTFARWHRNGDPAIGRPYITGTLLRSAVIRAAEELLFMNNGVWEEVHCCNGKFETNVDKNGKKPKFLRKRPTLQWPSNVKYGENNHSCPFCNLLVGWAGKPEDSDKGEDQKIENFGISFSNLNLQDDGKEEYNINDIALQRVLNRVDYTTGKAHDYFKVWEMDNEYWGSYAGTITLQNPVDSSFENLLMSALRFVGKLCGAVCRIEPEVLPGESKERNNITINLKDLKKDAEDIADAFEKAGKLEKVRILADAVRAMRSSLNGSNIVNQLPSGIDDRDHHVWDVKIGNGFTLKELLKKRSDIAAPNWRAFCETLGNELYLQYKQKGEGLTAGFRILGETEYYPQVNDTDTFISLSSPKGENKSLEWIIVGKFKAETPFFFGYDEGEDRAKGENISKHDISSYGCSEQTSARILLDRAGRYRIPRSLLRGVLRRDLRSAFGGCGCNVELGGDSPCDCPICLIMRKITVMDSRSDNYKEAPEIRHRIRINQCSGIVDEGALFDMEVAPEGITFPFVMRFRGSDAIPSELKSVMRFWKDGMAWLGGSGSTGKGRFMLKDVNMYEWDLSCKEGLNAYITRLGFRGIESTLGSEEITGVKSNNSLGCQLEPYEKHLKSKWIKYEEEVEITAPLLSGDPIAALLDPENRDAVAYVKREWDDEKRVTKYVHTIKGESIRGIVRTAVGKRHKDLTLDDHEECECNLCVIFGNTHNAGKIRFEDVMIENIPAKANKLIDHVAIDRFHGGAEDAMKFNTFPIAGSPGNPLILRCVYWIKDDLAAEYQEKIKRAFKDIQNGLYPIGGKKGIGYGWVKGPDNISARGNTAYKFPEQETSAIDPNHIYYPHYFIEPHEVVNREHEMIGHEQFHEECSTGENKEKTLSGRIECKLTTVAPLVIPDTEDENVTDENGHKRYKFFRLNGEPLIPGSEIRGVVSSVYEALTNSCFRIFGEKQYLSRRMDPGDEGILKEFVPGIVREKDGSLFVQKLKEQPEKGTDGETLYEEYRLPLYDNEDDGAGKPTGPLNRYDINGFIKKAKKGREQKIKGSVKYNNEIARVAKRNRDYLKQKKDCREILAGKVKVNFKVITINKNNPYDKIVELSNSGFQSGYIKFTGLNMVNVSNLKTGQKEGGFSKEWDIWSLNILHNKVEPRHSQLKEYPRPYLGLKIDGKEYKIQKRCERIFVPALQNENLERFTISTKVKDQYNSILKDYEKNFGHINKTFMTLLENCELKDGAMVYFKPDNNGNKVCDAITPVRISRMTDADPQGKRLPDKLRPCDREYSIDVDERDTGSLDNSPFEKLFKMHPKGLCPACRLFGTTNYRSRIRFGFAGLMDNKEPGWLIDRENENGGSLTLPLLERPRPTWSMPSGAKGIKVPGRKFYGHHNGWNTIRENQKNIEKNENNRTVEPLGKDNEFRFEVYFENLKEWELGLLLYSLELEPDMGHKLGMAKPMGFGSIKIKVEDLQTITMKNDDLGWESHNDNIGKYLDNGFLKLKEWFGSDWNKVDHIKNLRSMLRINDGKLVVKYPVLNEDSERYDKENGYTYVELEKLEHDERIKLLQEPWASWHRKIDPVKAE